tara:strand:+ start:43168 stop:47196 length:4029 start_codon:yes stop_codon:yes gene_type:complete
MTQNSNDFNSIRISLASPEKIRAWSHGEVTKPETINYRTLRPEKDGLFCERIFGPTKDWECYCGKYKKIRYKGVTCDRCGVEIARSKVRRERMGSIELAAPVAHIWFSKGTPSRIGMLLDMSPRNLDRVLYFAQYMVTSISEDSRSSEIAHLKEVLESELNRLDADVQRKLDGEDIESVDEVAIVEKDATEDQESSVVEKPEPKVNLSDKEIKNILAQRDQQKSDVENEILNQISDLEDLRLGGILTENRYRQLKSSFEHVFTASMGAEAVLESLGNIDLDLVREDLREEMRSTSGQRRKKAIKRIRVVEAFRKSGNKPEWMIFTTLPVLPPELRPMVQLDGGRFATSDLNDLYRRVINRNNRLKRLIELQAPEIIVRNEKRMLQESVDALVDNGRRGRPVSGSHNHKLKSLSDLLRGKQGRFRQNLLGKRVDYSGRSVIIAGPKLKLNQCGLPRRMALELFKPFVMNKLVMKGYAHNIKSAKRMAEQFRPEVWDILEQVVSDRPVLLNRAPTLHRLGIQAFNPVLIEGSAIQVHPLVCTAFNADFDGDQMAVHVPLSREAVLEAKRLMLSSLNLLSPSSGDPIVAPTLDMVLGCYYLTMVEENGYGTGKQFSNFEDAQLGYDMGIVGLRSLVKIKQHGQDDDSEWLETTPGRIIFNQIIPDGMAFSNIAMDKTALKDLTSLCHRKQGTEETGKMLDEIKSIGFRYASKAGITIAINDIEVSETKQSIVANADKKVRRLDEQYMDGLITDEERYTSTIQVWTDANDELTDIIETTLHNYGGLYLMATSGAKGNIAQIKQMAGMRGLMSDPRGRIIDRPIKSNFREGLSVLEYFISTHGARKGLADTALRTADSGYLTRRLIDVSQEIIILSEDCGTMSGIWLQIDMGDEMTGRFSDHAVSRTVAHPVADPSTGEIFIERNQILDEAAIELFEQSGIGQIMVRSPMTCEAETGLCRMCYGNSLASMEPVMVGEAVGIIAAQSIGEPGTQLTMRTFHTGGIAAADITSGLPRVEELFEARAPKGEAILSEIDGIIDVTETGEGRTVSVTSREIYADDYQIGSGMKALVKNGDLISIGDDVVGYTKVKEKELKNAGESVLPMKARVSGRVVATKTDVSITWEDDEEREYLIPAAAHLIVKSGDDVVAGQSLTAGPKNPQHILRIEGKESVQKYLIDEVQKVYRSQGVAIHNKHIEVITAQMLKKVWIDSPGDTEMLPGEIMDRGRYEETNASTVAEGGEPASASPVLLGITRAALHVDSFLAASSFQETIRVLTEASVNGQVDGLLGLKENVIIGSLIPARYDLTEEGREKLGLNEPVLEPVGLGQNVLAETFGIESLIEQKPGK